MRREVDWSRAATVAPGALCAPQLRKWLNSSRSLSEGESVYGPVSQSQAFADPQVESQSHYLCTQLLAWPQKQSERSGPTLGGVAYPSVCRMVGPSFFGPFWLA